jgi:hypothetical protein
MTAGPDAIRSLAPKQIYALEWRITLDGFFEAPSSTGSPSRHHRPSHGLRRPRFVRNENASLILCHGRAHSRPAEQTCERTCRSGTGAIEADPAGLAAGATTIRCASC